MSYLGAIKNLKRDFSLFAALCGLVALGYVGYRIFLIAGPTGLEGILHSRHAAAVEIGCNHDDDPVDAAQAASFVSGSYQELIRKSTSKGANLVANSSLSAASPDSGAPVGYYHIIDSKNTTYSYTRDRIDKAFFLRTVNTKSASAKEITGGWVMNTVPLEDDGTYAYSLDYRSTAPVSITLEYTAADGTLTYQDVTELPAQAQWHNFTAHIYNLDHAKKFRFVAVSHKAGNLDTRNYSVHRIADAQLASGLVSVTFDDGWQSVYAKALPILNKYHILTTQYIISDASEDKVGGYMDVAAIKKLKDAGHEIGSHSLRHCDLTQLSPQNVELNAKSSETALEKSGLGKITSFAYPYGKYDQGVEQTTAKYYAYMRSTDAGYNDRYFDNRNIRAMVITSHTTDTELASWLQYAKDNQLWLVLVYHRVDEHGDYSIPSSRLDKQLKMVKDSGMNVLPLSAAAQQIRY